MKLNEMIRRLKKLQYKTGNVDCVSSLGDNFVPVEWYDLPLEVIGGATHPPRVVFGPIGTKATAAKKARADKIQESIEEAQSDKEPTEEL